MVGRQNNNNNNILIIQHLYSALKSCKGYGGAERYADIADNLHLRDVAMATFWLSMGYNFRCMIVV